LLDIAYRRLTGRSGPGAGRPAKVYRRAVSERAVSVPPRDYARAAHLFAEAIERSGAETTLYDVARAQGSAAGRALGHDPASVTLRDLERHLAERGYEPYTDQADVRLRNCPFHSLAREFPVVACGMNLALLEGLVGGTRLASRYVARLDPRPGECCVAIGSKTDEI